MNNKLLTALALIVLSLISIVVALKGQYVLEASATAALSGLLAIALACYCAITTVGNSRGS